jgi:imidazolonepropionase-like amidohydrolase
MHRTARSTIVTAGLLLAAATSLAHDQIPGADQTRPVLLRGGDLYTVSGAVLEETDLLFEGGVITQIGVGLTPPAAAEVIDASGSRVYPGLIAPQTAVGLSEIGAVRATRDLDESGTVTPEVAAHVAYNPDSEIIPTVRSHGITTAQVAPQGMGIAGRSFITHLDGWTKEDAGVRLVDGLVVNWPRAGVADAWWIDATPEEQRERSARQRREIREAFDKARTYHRAREAGEQSEIDLRWEVMRPLWTGEMRLFVNASDYREILEAVAFAAHLGLELVIVGGAEAYRLTDLLRENDVAVILDVTTGLPYRTGDDYDAQYKQARLLHEAGVRFCIGIIGTAWGFRNLAFEGAGQAVAYGLPPEAALRAITLSTAEILGIDDTLGSLEVGKEATLFVSSGDVMDTLGHNVIHMFIRGKAVDLDNRHKTLYRKYRQKIDPAANHR